MNLYDDDENEYGDYEQEDEELDDEDLNEEEGKVCRLNSCLLIFTLCPSEFDEPADDPEEDPEDDEDDDEEDEEEGVPLRGRNAQALQQDQEEDDSFK